MFRGAIAVLLLLVSAAGLWGATESMAVYGIGTRIIGDQLLMKDVLESPPAGVGERATIRFNYAISEPITYIEIISKENVLADVKFSYQQELVVGSVTRLSTFSATPPPLSPTPTPAKSDGDGDDDNDDDVLVMVAPLVDTSATGAPTAAMGSQERFTIEIVIYGLREPMLGVNPSYILNRYQDFQGLMGPIQNDEEFGEQTEDYEDYTEPDYNSEPHIDQTTVSNGNGDASGTDEDYDVDFEGTKMNKYIDVGQRGDGDYLVYETYQVSTTHTDVPTNHSVVFYYIDSNYITYVKFEIFDYYVGKDKNAYVAPLGDYTHFSPTTLKATITDYQTTSLFVHMMIYGYKPHDRPRTYVPFITSQQHYGNMVSEAGGTEAPSLRQLKKLLNAVSPKQRVEVENETKANVMSLVETERSITEAPTERDVEAVDDATAWHNVQEISMHNGAVALTPMSNALALNVTPVFSDRAVKTWWMVALSLLRLVTAQPRA